MSSKLAIPCAASVVVSLQAGSLLFGSVVDVPTIAALDEQTLRKLFPVWWPYGAKLMIPLVGLSVASALGAYAVTDDRHWLTVAALAGFNLPYTRAVMYTDIKACLAPEKLSADELKETATRFGAKHHVRTVVATAGAIFAVITLTKRLQ